MIIRLERLEQAEPRVLTTVLLAEIRPLVTLLSAQRMVVGEERTGTPLKDLVRVGRGLLLVMWEILLARGLQALLVQDKMEKT